MFVAVPPSKGFLIYEESNSPDLDTLLMTLHCSAQYSKQRGRSHHADVREANVYPTIFSK